MKVFWINVTNNCNLHCLYCYQNLRNKNELSEEKAKKIIKMISEYSGDVLINFFGGEPFLNPSIIKFIVNELSEIEYINPHYSITTNLTVINDETMQFIIKNDISLTVSIDGDEQTFNLNRFNKNNNINYFELVRQNLEYFQKMKFEKISLVKVITYNNYQNLAKDAIFLCSFNFPVYFNFDQNILNWNNSKIDIDIFKKQLKEIFNYYIDNKKENLKFFNDLFKQFGLMFICEENYPQKECCTNIDNMIYSFDTEGNVFPCHVMNEIYYDKNYEYKESNIENLKENINIKNLFLPFDYNEKYNYFKKMRELKDCDNCEYAYYCYLEEWNRFENMCTLSRFKIRNDLNLEVKEENEYFCFKKYLFDMVFDSINLRRISIDDII